LPKVFPAAAVRNRPANLTAAEPRSSPIGGLELHVNKGEVFQAVRKFSTAAGS